MFNKLNEQQRLAVESDKRRLLILAGAGSGKTSVITLRIAHLISQRAVAGDSILGLTFTNKAAEEMRQKLFSFIPRKEAEAVTLCTFHSFCLEVLRRYITHLGYEKEFTLYDERDLQRLLKQILDEEGLEWGGQAAGLSAWVEDLSRARSQGSQKDSLESLSEEASRVYLRLKESMRSHNVVDFDSMLTLTLELFETVPEVLQIYRNRYRYLMVDEYQDSNPVQSRLVELLAGQNNHLCVVGDDDQSIYAWRGAQLGNILHFQADQSIKLEQNYRSTQIILGAANHLIEKNTRRRQKKMWSARTEGPLVQVFHAPTAEKEAQAVVYRLRLLKERFGLAWKDIAILYRSNLLSRFFEMSLLKAAWKEEGEWKTGIPYEVFGGQEFFDRSEIKDFIAYLRLLVNPQDQMALLRVINVPRRGIGSKALASLTEENRRQGVSLWSLLQNIREGKTLLNLSASAQKGVVAFVSTLEELKEASKDQNVFTSMDALFHRVSYTKALEEENKNKSVKEKKENNLRDFIDSARSFQGSLSEFLTDSALDGDRMFQKKGKKGRRPDAVRLMSLHAAKGLEFEACFLVALEEGIVPHHRSLKEGDLEGERCLMYVGMTRAKKYLTLSMACRRKRMGKEKANQPSPFLFELPKKFLQASSWESEGFS